MLRKKFGHRFPSRHYYCYYHHEHDLQNLLDWDTVQITTKTAKPVHALSITSGSDPPVSFHNRLISIYASSGETPIGRKVFDAMPLRNSVSNNSMVAAYGRDGHIEDSLEIVFRMLAAGVRPTQFSFGSILASPSAELHHGAQLHPLMLKSGVLHAGPFSATALLGLFARHGELDNAVKLFEDVSDPGVVTWNSLISGFTKQGLVEDSMLLFRELLRSGIELSECSFLSILPAVRFEKDSKYGEQVHSLAISNGMDSCTVVANALLNMYSISFGARMADRLFVTLSSRDVVSWNTIIAAFARSVWPGRAFELFFRMCLDGFSPTESTFSSVIDACVDPGLTRLGELFHAKAVKHSAATGTFAGSALVDFYANHKRLEDAEKLFDEIPRKTVVSWNALISGYSKNGSRACVTLLQKMLYLGFRPNEFSFSAGLCQCSVAEVWQLHSLIIRMGYEHNDYVLAAMIASYSSRDGLSEALEFTKTLVPPLLVAPTNTIAGIYNRCGRFQEAHGLLSHLQEPDGVSWNILIASCSRNGEYKEALLLCKKMLDVMIFPDRYTAVSLLSICTKLNRLDLGSSFHGLFIKTDFRSFDVFVHNVLLDMYSKCGSLESSLRVFEEMDERNLISWTALITALGLHGHAHQALDKFRQMKVEGFVPDRVSFVAILSACRHAGMVEEGMSLFQCMKSVYQIEPDMDHYVCIVDLLCRNGHLKEAGNVISSMPFLPSHVVWRTFLEGCRKMGEKEVM